MPRTRRTPASETPAPDAASVETPPVASDAPSPEDSSQNAVTNDAALSSPIQDAPAKPTRRRGTRLPAAEVPAEAVPDAAEAPAETAPARRRGRRTAATEAPAAEMPAAAEVAAEVPAAETPVAETPVAAGTEAPAPRRRGRRTATPEAPAAEPVAAEAPALEAAAPETPAAEAPTSRRRGRRTSAPEAPPVETTAAPIPEDAPLGPATSAAPTRRRGQPRPTEAPAAEAAPTSTARPPSRRRGQPRVAEAPAADLTETPEETEEAVEETSQVTAPVAEEAPQEGARTSRRRGRRRGGAAESSGTPPAPPALELPDVEAPVEEEPADEEVSGEAADDADKRGRRPRRSRRRRGGNDELTTEMLEAAGAGLILDDTVVEPVASPEEDEDDTLLAYPPPAAPVFYAPPIVPPVLPPARADAAPRLTASVRREGRGLPQISVSGPAGRKEYAPYFFFVNAEAAPDSETVEAQIRAAAANGVHLFSGVMYLPLRNTYGDRSFGAIDALIQQVLSADPEGYVLPRLQFFPTNYWARTHADQMARYAGGEEGDVSLASTEFWADCVDALEALIAHFADPSTPGGDRVLGFHLDRGEWFTDAESGYDLSLPNTVAFQNWLHAKYQAPHALRSAWHDAQVTWEDAAVPVWSGKTAPVKKTDTPLYASRREGRWPDYAQFSSELAAGIIAGLAEAIKTFSQSRMIVAASYGYILEFAGRNDSGHLALGKLLQSPHIDIVAGPNSYAGRAAGSPAAFPAPIDSVALHGKLWLVEDDTKTFLAEAETEDTYNPKIASGADTPAIHQRHFGSALAHRAGVTWMDLWGQGWLNSPDIWRELGGLTAQAERWGRLVPNPPPTPDVAVLVDESSLRFLKNDANGLGTHLVGRTRDLLLRAGASVGFYLQSDVTRPDFPDAKLYLFVNALRLTTDERTAIRENLQKSGKTLAWLYAPGVFDENGPTTEDVGEVVGLALRPQPWNSRGGSLLSEAKHPITDRIRNTRKIGQDEILNPLYAVSDPQATVVAEYAATGATSLATREHKAGWKSVFFGDPYLTMEMLRGLYAYANVPVYDTQDDIVYAGADGSLTIHGTSTGQRTISLPRRASVYDVFDNKIVATDVRTFRAFVRARTTRFFLWGEGRELAAITGLDLPARSAEVADAAPASEAPLVSPPPPPSRSAAPPPASVISDPADVEDILAGFDTSPAPTALARPAFESQAVTFAGDEPGGDDIDAATDSEEGAGDAGAPARRSRWQRRRAAARARRDAEREAKLAGGTSESGEAADPPLDIAALLPGLPPRRTPAPTSTTTEVFPLDVTEDAQIAFGEPSEPAPADRIAGILAADTAADDTLDIPPPVQARPGDFDDDADDFDDDDDE